MKNPNSPLQRAKRLLLSRWSAEDYPGALPRFQIPLLAKDIAVFVLLPLAAVLLYKMIAAPTSNQKRIPSKQLNKESIQGESSKSQIIEFRKNSGGDGSAFSGIAKKSPGTLVRVHLLNVVETYSTAPVHAQVIDAGLGRSLMGGTLIGDAVPDTNFERINITFRFVRDPNREGVAVPLSARALSLDGTLGLDATKKEGFVTRAAIGSAHATSQDLQGKSNPTDFKDILLRALTAGLVQEFGSVTQVEKNRAQVLTLPPSTDFFAELTDYFPGGTR